MRKLLFTPIALIVILIAVSEGFIQFALRPALHDDPVSEWEDSVMRCRALRDTFLVSDDSGDSIHAWYLRADSATDKVAVLVHGYGNDGLMMGKFAEIYDRHLNYNILLPDLHYHGQSKGDYIQMGWRDRLDVMQWCEFADKLFDCDGKGTKQVLHGVSMGAATIMSVSGETQPRYIRCFVEDCGYTSVWDEFSNELDSQFSLPPFPLLYTTSWLNKLQNGWSFSEASPINQVAKCQRPMLFIHGGDDSYVKTEMVYRLYDAKREPKQLKIFEGSQHAMSFDDNKDAYTQLVKSFVNKYNK